MGSLNSLSNFKKSIFHSREIIFKKKVLKINSVESTFVPLGKLKVLIRVSKAAVALENVIEYCEKNICLNLFSKLITLDLYFS